MCRPRAVDHLAGRGLRQVADRRDPAARDADIARALAVLIDDGAAAENGVEGLGHVRDAGLVSCLRDSAIAFTFAKAARLYKVFDESSTVSPIAASSRSPATTRARFLNGLVTADIDKVDARTSRAMRALLTPQGKIIVDFIVVEADADDGGGFFIDCPRALAAGARDRSSPSTSCAPR